LQSLTLNTDFEFHADDLSTLGMTGVPPAEVVAETDVDYNSYTLPAFGTQGSVHTDHIAYRSPEMFQQAETTTVMPNQVIFEAPVFDDQVDFDLSLTLTETDYYPRVGVNEVLTTGFDKTIVQFTGTVTLTDQVVPISDSSASAQLQVQVVDLY